MNFSSEISWPLSGFLMTNGLLAIFVVMLVKEMGLPLPIPSDFITIMVGVLAAAGSFTLLELAVVLSIAVFIGSSAQYYVVRSAGRPLLYRGGRFVGLTPERLDRSRARLSGRGPVAVFIGLNIPGARAGVICAAALVGLKYPTVALAIVSGTAIFYGWHIALGYFLGPSAISLLESANVSLWLVVFGLVAVGIIGLIILNRERVKELFHGRLV